MRDRAGAGENKPVRLARFGWRHYGRWIESERDGGERGGDRPVSCLWWKFLGERPTPQQRSGLLFDSISFFSFPLVSGA